MTSKTSYIRRLYRKALRIQIEGMGRICGIYCKCSAECSLSVHSTLLVLR